MQATAETAAPRAAARGAQGQGLSILVVLFLVGLIIPSIIQLGPLRLSVYRVVLLMVTVPCLFMWASGRAGRMRIPDFAILLLWAWSALSFTVHHGFGPMIERNGIFFLETVGTYFLARCYIRTAADFHAMVRVFYRTVIVMLPFALYETLTGHALILSIFGLFSETLTANAMDPRLGLHRVQGPFDHQILFGVYCGSMLAMVHMVLGYGEPVGRRAMRTGSVMFTAFFALSSGPLTAQVVQIMLMGWNWAFRKVAARWKILTALSAGGIGLIEAVANRSTPEILISYFAFNTWTAMNRIRIWEYGSANVIDNPLFGLGLNDWVRPYWMLPSVDMFWLLPAMRNGLPAVVFLATAVLGIFLQAAFRKGLDARTSSYRTAYLISLMGMIMAGWTVHYWNSTYVLLIFMVGAGAWFADAPQEPDETRAPAPQDRDAPGNAAGNAAGAVSGDASGDGDRRRLPYARRAPVPGRRAR
ncbi:MAG: hypothetical protein HUJ24_05140 [Rhodobacteraceae bacterium]|nr:hypothetical protein [Paracoccaceae bacterium]